MKHCQQCQSELSAHHYVSGVCPQCGVDLTKPVEEEGWSSIARLANLAEVGYFADLLDGQDIASNVRQHNQFNALEGGWQTSYYLQVQQADADRATEAMQRELEEMENAQPWDTQEEVEEPTFSTGVWRPVVLMLVAGGIAYCAGRGSLGRPAMGPASESSLWQMMTESTRPLESPAGLGEPRRRLRYDDRSNTVLLEEDYDDDGQFDRQRLFRQGELIRDAQP